MRKSKEKDRKLMKLKKSYIESRLGEKCDVDVGKSLMDLYKELKKKNMLQIYDNKSSYCVFKVDNNVIVLFFVIDLTTELSKSTTETSDYVMSIVDTIESTFVILDKHYKRELSETDKRFIGLLEVFCSDLLLEEQNKLRQYVIF